MRMEVIGLVISLKEFAKQIASFSIRKTIRDSEETQRDFLNDLVILSESLDKASKKDDPLITLQVEQLCIGMEKGLYASTSDEEARLDKQLVESMTAEDSLALVGDIDGYRKRAERARKLGVSPSAVLQGESYATFINRQLKYLSSAKTGLNEPEEKAFFNARQINLRAGLKNFQELQRRALLDEKNDK